VAAFGRHQTIGGSMEGVRGSGRDLAVNVSTHGYGYAYFAARRLNHDIVSAFAILKRPEVQKAFGVSSLYQVIERVASLAFGVAPAITRYCTRAEAGKKILGILARNSSKWTFSRADRDALIKSVEQWLAVSGDPDDKLNHLSQPRRVRHCSFHGPRRFSAAFGAG
jgi:hypothetical protein